MKKVMVLFLFVVVSLSCQQSAESDYVAAASLSAMVDTTAVEVEAIKIMANSLPEKESTFEPKIIKNADLRYQTDNLEDTYKQILTTVKKYKANVQFDAENKEYRELSRSLTIRVPSTHFDTFITDISKGVGYFDRKEISSSDVSEEFIDVSARIKTKKVLENRYLELLKKATKISEMLEIEKQLSTIREEIEAKEGRLNYLKNKVSLSTITINFYKPLANENNATVSYGSKLKNAILSGFNGVSNFVVWLIQIWPILLILILLALFIKRKLKKKTTL